MSKPSLLTVLELMPPGEKDRSLCRVKFCRRCPASGKDRICSMHKMQQWRARHPVRALWSNLKWRAKGRGLKFSLSVKDVEVFCQQTGYLELVGRGKEDMHIDRIDVRRGYEPGNIQMLVQWRNRHKEDAVDAIVRRFNSAVHYDEAERIMREFEEGSHMNEEGDPF